MYTALRVDGVHVKDRIWEEVIIMKALTLWQPWASLLACGAKKYETRSWVTSYRGPIAFHAAKKPFNTLDFAIFDPYFAKAAVDAFEQTQLSINRLPLGAIIATAELVNCWYIVVHPGTNVDISKHIPIGAESMTNDKHRPDFADYFVPTEQEMAFGDWTPGRYAWEFANIKLLPEPIPTRGGQRLWTWERIRS